MLGQGDLFRHGQASYSKGFQVSLYNLWYLSSSVCLPSCFVIQVFDMSLQLLSCPLWGFCKQVHLVLTNDGRSMLVYLASDFAKLLIETLSW